MTQNNQPVKPILLEVKEITKVFGGTVALNDVSSVSYTHLPCDLEGLSARRLWPTHVVSG